MYMFVRACVCVHLFTYVCVCLSVCTRRVSVSMCTPVNMSMSAAVCAGGKSEDGWVPAATEAGGGADESHGDVHGRLH